MLVEILLVLVTLFLLLYRYVTKKFGKWEAMGVPCVSGTFPGGSHSELTGQTRHFNEFFLEDYRKFSGEKFFGTYLFGKPCLNLRDPELIRWLLVKNFNCFVDRDDSNIGRVLDGGETDQFWLSQMTSKSGDEWKDIRSTFTPIFTSGKLRGMMRFIQEVSTRLTNDLRNKAESGEDFELKDTFGKYSLDSLAVCAFGIDPKSFNSKESVFVKNAARMFQNTAYDQMMFVLRLIPGVSWLHKKLNISFRFPKETKFFIDVLRNVIKQRKSTGVRENDIIDLMIDCLKQDGISEKEEADLDQYEKDMQFNHQANKKNMDEDTIVATAMVLLVAGYDTTGMSLAFMAYYLSKNPDIQAKLQQEVDTAFEENDGEIPDYSAIQALPYLDMCIMETLRLESLVGVIIRTCTEDCILPGTSIPIKKNEFVMACSIGLHHDEQYYPEPEKFNPENFSKEAKQSRSPYTFLAFGQGPRGCIGMRFAMLEMKLAMVNVLREFTFLPSAKTPDKLKIDPSSQLAYIKGGLFARIERRDF